MRTAISRRVIQVLCVILVLAIYGAYIVAQTSRKGHDITSFIVAGISPLIDTAIVSQRLRVGESPYDGIAYYRLAADPFTGKVTDLGITLDNPPYRHQRILYPLLAWIFSFGKIELVPYALVAVNLIGLCILTWLAALYTNRFKLPVLYALIFPFHVGCLFVITRDLAEILQMTALVALFLCLHDRKYKLAAVMMVLAVLTRETALIVALVGLGLHFAQWTRSLIAQLSLATARSLGKVNLRADSPYIFIPAIIAVIALQVWLLQHWSGVSVSARVISSNFNTPFVGYIQAIAYAVVRNDYVGILNLVEYALIFIFGTCVAIVIIREKIAGTIEVAWWVYLALALSLSAYVWSDDWSFLRVNTELFTLGYLILIRSSRRITKAIALINAPIWLFMAFNLLRMR